MAEPSTAAGIAGTAAVAAMLAAVGVSPHALFWALIGTTLGLSVAPSAGRWRAGIVFACAALASALLGTFAGAALFPAMTGKLPAAGSSLLFGLLFHPLFTAATGAVPSAVAGLLAKLGLGSKP
jgi:hypothetical protein